MPESFDINTYVIFMAYTMSHSHNLTLSMWKRP